MKCREFQFGDWCCNEYGLPMQMVDLGKDYAYATYEGDEGYPWLFSDSKDKQPHPIVLTSEILEKNEWKRNKIFMDMKAADYINFSWTDKYGGYLLQNGFYMCECKYAHTLQHALRLCGLDELADNFKM